MSIRDSVNRWRHRRGFGVHSPAAFMLVKEIVRPHRRFRYYAEDRIDNLKISEREREILHIIIRLYGRLRPSSVSLSPKSKLNMILRAERIGEKCSFRTRKEDYDSDEVVSMDFAKETGEKGRVYVFGFCPDRKILEMASDSSILISSRHYSIVYHLPGLTSIHVTV